MRKAIFLLLTTLSFALGAPSTAPTCTAANIHTTKFLNQTLFAALAPQTICLLSTFAKPPPPPLSQNYVSDLYLFYYNCSLVMDYPFANLDKSYSLASSMREEVRIAISEDGWGWCSVGGTEAPCARSGFREMRGFVERGVRWL